MLTEDNPIEWVWSDLKRFVRKYYCKNAADVLKAVEEFHKTLTPEYCRKYIDHLKQVLNIHLNIIHLFIIFN